VAAFMSRRTAVTYLGRIVETGPSQAIVRQPRHHYTQALIAAVPEPDPTQRHRGRRLTGDVPSPIERPTGCPFHPRCPPAQPICAEEEPALRQMGPEHQAACHCA
jgi:oligopeptide/dipeptide ABC transporter ATP-binding protein